MLILVMMLIVGLLAGTWGFMACFLPTQWDRLTDPISFADRWTVPSPKRLHPLIRLGYRAVGIVICVVGCWFAYVAASSLYRVLTNRAAFPVKAESIGSLPNTSMVVGNVFALLMIMIGAAIVFFPAKMVKFLEIFWPTRRLVNLSAPKVALVIRVLGAIFTLIAMMFLIH